jgi:hypothetical protein
MIYYWRSPLPRAPHRPRVVRCYSDCAAQITGEPDDCHCIKRDDAAYDAECERRLDAWRDGDGA